jgi:transposase
LALGLLLRQNRQRLLQIGRQLAAIDAAVAELVRGDADLRAQHAILLSIPGVGPVTAWHLLAGMPEPDEMSGKQAGCLAVLAQITRQSGQWRGKSFITADRSDVRHALYMSALVAMCYKAHLKLVFERLSAAGKPFKVALVAVIRRLIVLVNALLKERRTWQHRWIFSDKLCYKRRLRRP